ncbi:hypothetical protein [Chromohalobacter sp. 296-RDG]|uniref:hypothetical protein n=1 Tax=Chromohalobacter sp. 296-RDG TaxID=2994062 RepID=UPI002468DCB1|nr:hypothetical protein [Chromohalobacter sp. 296-RDG]
MRDGLLEYEGNRGAIVREWADKNREKIFKQRMLINNHVISRTAKTISPTTLDEIQGNKDRIHHNKEALSARARNERWAQDSLECLLLGAVMRFRKPQEKTAIAMDKSEAFGSAAARALSGRRAASTFQEQLENVCPNRHRQNVRVRSSVKENLMRIATSTVIPEAI